MADRIVARAVVATCGLIIALLLNGPAHADVQVDSTNGGFDASGQQSYGNFGGGAVNTADSSHPSTHTILTACEGDGACPSFTCPPGQARVYYETVRNSDGVPVATGTMCLGGEAISMAAAVQHAFRRIPVPTPTLHIQPVKGRTLVNLKTNFYATGGATFTRSVTVLGHHVTLRIHVARYGFSFGDGHSLSTSSAGRPYPHLVNTHIYLHEGVVHPRLSVTWAADYRVDGGAWRTVDGTVSKTGASQRLRVVTATPVLTGP